MAANKRKILEAARKLAQKGAKEKALKEYEKLLKLDPKDAKLRLEIGDAHRRWGQVEQAVDTYNRVAEQYMAEGFDDARAVAVYKQIVNLDPDCLDAYAPLAELYERMGLGADAIACLQTAADGFHRQGKRSEALELLRRMANADPSNTTSRIKVADLLRQEGMDSEALAEYELAAEELKRQNEVEVLGNVYRRMLEIDEQHVGALGALAENLSSRGKVEESVPLAERALALDDSTPEHYELLAELYGKTGRDADRSDVYRRLAQLFRARGDDDTARNILQRYVPSEDLGGEASSAAAPEPGVRGSSDPDDLFESEFEASGEGEVPLQLGESERLDVAPLEGESLLSSNLESELESEPVELTLDDPIEPFASNGEEEISLDDPVETPGLEPGGAGRRWPRRGPAPGRGQRLPALRKARPGHRASGARARLGASAPARAGEAGGGLRRGG